MPGAPRSWRPYNQQHTQQQLPSRAPQRAQHMPSQQQPCTPSAPECLSQEAWRGYLQAAGRTAVCLRLRGMLGHLDMREQQQLVKEAWAWLAYEGPVR